MCKQDKTQILKSEGVLFNVYPCQGYQHLEQIIEDLKELENLRSILFINCGALIDLTQSWFAQNDRKIKAYILDNHRPIQHENILSERKIIVVDDEISNLDNCPTQEDIQLYQNQLNEQDENSSEGEFQFDNDEDDDQDELENQFGENLSIKNEKRKQSPNQFHKKKQKKLKIIQESEQKIQEYYEGYYYGIPTAYLSYQMSLICNKISSDQIWLGILGLTDMYLHQKLNEENYLKIYLDIKSRLSQYGIYEQEFTDNHQNYEIGQIIPENDYKFMLLKHWNLYDSIKYSNVIGPKLGIWNEKNKKGELESLIAKLGIPLEQAEQQYKFMDYKHKKQLKNKLVEVGDQFKLSDVLLINSFIRQIDQTVQISASDMVYCLQTVLECPKSILEKVFSEYQLQDKIQEQKQTNNNQNNNNNDQQQNNDNQYSDDFIIDESRSRNFYWAVDLIKEAQNSRVKLIKEAINIAIDFQKAMVNEATFLIERNAMESNDNFRYCIIKKEQLQHQKFFQNPFSLQKLGMYIMEIYKYRKNEYNNMNQQKPIILACQQSKSETYLVTGIIPIQLTDAYIKKKQYDPDESPPDIRKAKKHGQAQRVCKDIDYTKYVKSKCECCGKAIDNELLSMCDHPNNLQHLGTTYPLYFVFIKQCFIMIAIHMCIQAIPSLIIYQKKDRKSVQYYSIILKKIPPQVSVRQIEKFLDRSVQGSSQDIKRIFILYDLKEYEKALKERKEEVDLINQLKLELKQVPLNQKYTDTQIKSALSLLSKRVEIELKFKEQLENKLQNLQQFYINDQQIIRIKEAPEPSDILWTGLGATNSKQKIRILSNIFIIISMLSSLAVIVTLKIIIRKSSSGYSTFWKYVFNLVAALVVALANVSIGIIIRKMASKEQRTTQTSYFIQVGQKLTQMFLVNMILTIFFANLLANILLPEEQNELLNVPIDLINLIGEYFFLFITNSYISSIMSIFDIVYGFRLFQRYILQRNIRKTNCWASQQDANSIFEGHPIDMALRYANVLKVVLYTLAISVILPIGPPMCLLGLIIIYWADKFLIYRRMVCNNYISKELAKKMNKMLHLSPILFATGNIGTFALLIYNQFDGDFNQQTLATRDAKLTEIKKQKELSSIDETESSLEYNQDQSSIMSSSLNQSEAYINWNNAKRTPYQFSNINKSQNQIQSNQQQEIELQNYNIQNFNTHISNKLTIQNSNNNNNNNNTDSLDEKQNYLSQGTIYKSFQGQDASDFQQKLHFSNNNQINNTNNNLNTSLNTSTSEINKKPLNAPLLYKDIQDTEYDYKNQTKQNQ
ncbi:hypothetical protein PPERSA_13109 [Pseudocohnilembus persalinus]|uniref:CSC1/OSCA1-like cytosolic domain-containing protein n=1 Tax=Pseudocohnilembus persalinus TaxID=266149 RepID=A0A0V0QWP6_PSEPJ|nr:hypothetical protein PPERSA_13109 [Pseudocohnilembus persalinus]|eukprot:KRX06630.1 hypothetical protein PPERSA_13109 [Pseudocohnilembus persalinus]